MGPSLLLPDHHFCLSHRKIHWIMSVDNVSLELCLLRTLNSMITLTIFFLGVNRCGPGTRSTTNHKFYKALGQLHGPWCKPARSVVDRGLEWYRCPLFKNTTPSFTHYGFMNTWSRTTKSIHLWRYWVSFITRMLHLHAMIGRKLILFLFILLFFYFFQFIFLSKNQHFVKQHQCLWRFMGIISHNSRSW